VYREIRPQRRIEWAIVQACRPTQLSLRLPPNRLVRFRVRRGDKAIDGALVSLSLREPQLLRPVAMIAGATLSAESDRAGKVRFPALPMGVYGVNVLHSGQQVSCGRIAHSKTSSDERVVELGRGRAQLEFRCAGKQPVIVRDVILTSDDRDYSVDVSTKQHEGGLQVASVTLLKPGAYSVLAIAANHSTYSAGKLVIAAGDSTVTKRIAKLRPDASKARPDSPTED
jgi:hypothetical protein